jgi:hypothetical protein
MTDPTLNQPKDAGERNDAQQSPDPELRKETLEDLGPDGRVDDIKGGSRPTVTPQPGQ